MAQKSGGRMQRQDGLRPPSKEDRGLTEADPDGLVQEGIAALEQGHVIRARHNFRHALRIQENDVDAQAYFALTFVRGREWERAATEAQKALAIDPTHAVGWTVLARAHFGAGRPVQADHAATRVLRQFYRDVQRGVLRPDVGTHVVDMLVFMQADRRLHQLYRRVVRGRPSRAKAVEHVFFGVAAFNRGHYQDARWAWRQAQLLQSAEHAGLFEACLFVLSLVEKGRIPPFRLDYRFGAPDRGDEEAEEPPGFLKVFALYTLWHTDDGEAQRAALRLLLNTPDEWAAPFLLAVLSDPDLSDDVKQRAHGLLLDGGLMPEDDELAGMKGWWESEGGEGAEGPWAFEHDGEGAEGPWAFEHDGEGPHGSSASDDDGGDPDGTRAEGEDDEGPGVLWTEKDDGKTELRVWSPDDVRGRVLPRYFYAAPAPGAAREEAARSVARRRKRYENQPIEPNMTLQDGLERLTVPRLQAVARRLGMGGFSARRKGDLAQDVADVLRTKLAAVWRALAPQEQAALRWIDVRGGTVAYDELRRRFGDDTDDSIDWWEDEPATVPMRLQFHGLLFVGRRFGTGPPVALIPQEVRHGLKFAGRRTMR